MKTHIVPTVTAYDLHEYRRQIELFSSFTKRLHIDLMDGIFAPSKSPDIDKLWLPRNVVCDVHVMFRKPFDQLEKLRDLNPACIILQAEADSDSVHRSIETLKKTKIRFGISLLQETQVTEPQVMEYITKADYVLVFSGHLGFHGGVADISLLHKVQEIRNINDTCEIAWDGGINKDNAHELVDAGVTVLNIGASIAKSADPERSYIEFEKLVD